MSVDGDEARGETFGQWLRRMLDQQNMSQAALAREIGVARSSVNWWANDATEPRADNVLAVAKVLGVDPRTALAAAGLVAPADDRRLDVLLGLIEYLPDERIEDAIRYLRFLIRDDE